MFAQVVEGGASLEKREEMDRLVHEELIPALRLEPGFAGAGPRRGDLLGKPPADLRLGGQRPGLTEPAGPRLMSR